MGLLDGLKDLADSIADTAQTVAEDGADTIDAAKSVTDKYGATFGGGSTGGGAAFIPVPDLGGKLLDEKGAPATWSERMSEKFGLPVWSVITLAVCLPVLLIAGLVALFRRK